jgi:hypothetical protein
MDFPVNKYVFLRTNTPLNIAKNFSASCVEVQKSGLTFTITYVNIHGSFTLGNQQRDIKIQVNSPWRKYTKLRKYFYEYSQPNQKFFARRADCYLHNDHCPGYFLFTTRQSEHETRRFSQLIWLDRCREKPLDKPLAKC